MLYADDSLKKTLPDAPSTKVPHFSPIFNFNKQTKGKHLFFPRWKNSLPCTLSNHEENV